MNFTADKINLNSHEGHIIRQMPQPESYGYEELHSLWWMTRKALDEEVEKEFEHLAILQEEVALEEALQYTSFGQFATAELSEMVEALTVVATGAYVAELYIAEGDD